VVFEADAKARRVVEGDKSRNRGSIDLEKFLLWRFGEREGEEVVDA